VAPASRLAPWRKVAKLITEPFPGPLVNTMRGGLPVIPRPGSKAIFGSI
jgi:hypothetical protein